MYIIGQLCRKRIEIDGIIYADCMDDLVVKNNRVYNTTKGINFELFPEFKDHVIENKTKSEQELKELEEKINSKFEKFKFKGVWHLDEISSIPVDYSKRNIYENAEYTDIYSEIRNFIRVNPEKSFITTLNKNQFVEAIDLGSLYKPQIFLCTKTLSIGDYFIPTGSIFYFCYHYTCIYLNNNIEESLLIVGDKVLKLLNKNYSKSLLDLAIYHSDDTSKYINKLFRISDEEYNKIKNIYNMNNNKQVFEEKSEINNKSVEFEDEYEVIEDNKQSKSHLTATWIEDNSFESVIKEMIDTYKRKNSDYGNSFDKSLDKFGLIASVVRLSDKFNRIEQLIQNKEQQVKDESIRDTFMDMANYCAMTVAWMDQQN
jgi:hypothetical protein